MTDLREKIADICRGQKVGPAGALARADAILALFADTIKDAQRYWFLSGAYVPQHSTRWSRWKLEHWDGYHSGWVPLTGTDLDAAIDAAKGAE